MLFTAWSELFDLASATQSAFSGWIIIGNRLGPGLTSQKQGRTEDLDDPGRKTWKRLVYVLQVENGSSSRRNLNATVHILPLVVTLKTWKSQTHLGIP